MALTAEQLKKLNADFNTYSPNIDTGKSEIDSIVDSISFSKPDKKKGLFGDTVNAITDIKESASKRMDTMDAIRADTESGKQGGVRSLLQQFGQGAGLASDVIGSVILGGVKQLTPDVIQEPVGEAIKSTVGGALETEPVKNLVNWYSNLDPQKKRDLDAVLGTVSLAGDVFGAGLAKPAGSALVKTAGQAVDKAVDVAKPLINTAKNVADEVVDPANIMQRVARINPTQQVKFKEMAGETVGEYLTSRKIFGSADEVVTKLVDTFQKSRQMADDAIDTLKGKFSPQPVKTAVDDLLKKEVSVSSKGALSKDLKTVMAWKNKLQSGEGMTMTEINQMKRMYERNVKLGYNKLTDSEKIVRATNIDTALRKWQVSKAEELGLANLPVINKETQLAKTLADALGKKLAGSEANNAVSITDWIILAGGDPTAIGGYIGKKAFSSGKFQSKVAEFASRNKTAKTTTAKFTKPRPSMEDFMKK